MRVNTLSGEMAKAVFDAEPNLTATSESRTIVRMGCSLYKRNKVCMYFGFNSLGDRKYINKTRGLV